VVVLAAPRNEHPLVTNLAGALNVAAPAGAPYGSGSSGAFANAADVPKLVMFVGFLGPLVPAPATGDQWQVLYLDLELRDWLLVEDAAIVDSSTITDDAVPFNQQRDVIWVSDDAPVGRGTGSQSVPASFLTGEFTRAADFDDAQPGSGTVGAATGVFCQRSIGCCTPKSR
jgi:hypothetical protein